MSPLPKDVNCRRLRGFRLDVCRDEEGNPNGLCENCTYAPSTHVFNIGATQHHLCAKCFAEMLMCFVGESVGHPVAQSAKDEEKHDAKWFKSYGEDYYVVDLGDGHTVVTRYRDLAREPTARKLLRSDIYKGREEDAEDEYAHQFICGGFPKERDPKRPSREEWMGSPPYSHEVDKFFTVKVLEGGGAKKCERAPSEEPKFVPILLSPDELKARRHKYAVEAVLRAKEWSNTLDMIDLGNKEDLKKVTGCDEKYVIVNSETIPPCITTNGHIKALMYSVERECSGKAIGERIFLTQTESQLIKLLSHGLLEEYCTELNGWSSKHFPKTAKETLLVMQSVCIFANAVLSYEELPLTMGTVSPVFPQTAGVKNCGQCLKKQIGDKGQCFCASQLRKYANILYGRDYFGTGDLKRCNGEENCVFFE